MNYQISFRCPHCRSRTISGDVRQISPTLQEVRYGCTDFECGFTFSVMVKVVRTLRPSAKPNNQITIPTVPNRKKESNRIIARKLSDMTIPETGFVTRAAVMDAVSSLSLISQRMAEGEFPRMEKISGMVWGWRVEDIREWIALHAA